MEKATELEFLKWFYCEADFGPAHSEIMSLMKEQFIKTENKDLPEGYGWYCDQCDKEMTYEEAKRSNVCSECLKTWE